VGLSGRGAAAGAVIGGLLRGVLTFINLGAGGGTLLVLMCLPSVGIGALCGVVAGATGHPIKGAIVGFVFAGLMFWLFVMPVAFLASMFGLAGKVEQFSFPYLLQRAIVGAVAGAAGGALGQQSQAGRYPVS
jgi:hypothetical protein